MRFTTYNCRYLP